MESNMYNPTTILITGASSGLGLAFLIHYASLPSVTRIIALDIHALPASLPQSALSKVTFHTANITSNDIHTLSKTYSTTPIDLLLHCAGVRGLVQSAIHAQEKAGCRRDVSTAETYEVMTRDTMLSTFEINTFGTFNVVTAFLGSMQQSPDPRVVVLSSRNGSIASNTGGGAYAYRASKVAVNGVVKSFAVDVPGVKWCLLHPGRVETGLVGWKEPGAMTVEESVRDCVKVIEGLGKDEKNGENIWFVDRFGETIPW